MGHTWFVSGSDNFHYCFFVQSLNLARRGLTTKNLGGVAGVAS